MTETTEITVKSRLIGPKITDPSPTVKPYFRMKLKNPIFRFALLGGVAFLLPMLFAVTGISIRALPLNQSAEASTIASKFNSQTVAVLTEANNIDPNHSVGGGEIVVVSGSALLPQTGPSESAQDPEKHAGSSQISVYIVSEGDTLSGIAEMFNVSVNTIAWANNIKGRIIRPGQELVILPVTGIQHTVEKGETLASIAKKYSGDAAEIAHFNELAAEVALAVGTTITIPDGEIAPPAKALGGGTSPARGGTSISGYYGWPLDGGVITQGIHGYNAVDIGARTGTNVVASAAGTVIIAVEGGWNGGYGSYVVIQHDNGTQTLYSHESRVLVSRGDRVSRGDVIGKVGSTGKSPGPHVHFEVRGAANPFR